MDPGEKESGTLRELISMSVRNLVQLLGLGGGLCSRSATLFMSNPHQDMDYNCLTFLLFLF